MLAPHVIVVHVIVVHFSIYTFYISVKSSTMECIKIDRDLRYIKTYDTDIIIENDDC